MNSNIANLASFNIETGEILYNTTYEGNEGDEYKTEQKEIEGYEFIEVVGETEGTIIIRKYKK